MSEENNDLKRLSRRNLLKAGAAAGVAAALPAGPAQAAQPVAEFRGGGPPVVEHLGQQAVVVEPGWQLVSPRGTLLIAPAQVARATNEGVGHAPHA